jgi:hypothetical protein
VEEAARIHQEAEVAALIHPAAVEAAQFLRPAGAEAAARFVPAPQAHRLIHC